ncbi:hypothetical protein ANCDUO_13301 [Ancylostoma duodenale]|uniref:Uncharacterized protein n=1 Tax=Ancylostoma duodenale TaxID=51022 RepID=A0A0C2CJB1_9BILA|nr:hypothetical protein ANCDUO_13301 [Ancylostoma duodenale]
MYKLREARLRWYCHVLWADNEYICKISSDLDVADRRPKGCPRQRWLDTLDTSHADLKVLGIQSDQVYDRAKWRRGIIARAPPPNRRNAEEEIHN